MYSDMSHKENFLIACTHYRMKKLAKFVISSALLHQRILFKNYFKWTFMVVFFPFSFTFCGGWRGHGMSCLKLLLKLGATYFFPSELNLLAMMLLCETILCMMWKL